MNYAHLHFGKLTQAEILRAVKDPDWQRFRVSLKGKTTEQKLRELERWLELHPGRDAEIRVTNYINALKRGGQLK